MCGRRKATCSLHHAQVAGPSSGSAPRSDADPRCVVTFGGDAKCHACRRRKPDIASENSPCGISRLLQITSTARTDAERTSDLRSLCRWPVKRDPGTIIISNFDKHLALGAHHQPELRERQALEFRTFSARSGFAKSRLATIQEQLAELDGHQRDSVLFGGGFKSLHDEMMELDALATATETLLEAAAQGPQRGRTRTLADHEGVATVYRSAYERGDPVTEAVARAFHVSRSTAGKRIMAARRAGLLEGIGRTR